MNTNEIELNIISQKLVNSTDNIYSNIEPKYKKELNQIVDNIYNTMNERNYFDMSKEFITNMNQNKLRYILVKSEPITLNSIDNVDTSTDILNKMNCMKIYELVFNSNKVLVTIYHNTRDDINILDKNVMKIMTRMHNLFLLYINKKDALFNLLKYSYYFYLYNNVRRANRNKSGKDYIDELHKSSMKCFNSSSGVTEFDNMTIRVTRTEDFLGLLTHEILHACSLIYVNIDSLNIHTIKVNMNEAYVNMFAAIVNCYLTCIENNINNVKKYILIEVIHSINHAIKFARIENYNIMDILNIDKGITLHQSASMYEYIVGKMILLLNFKEMVNSNKEFGNMIMSLDRPWSPSLNIYNSVIEKQFIKFNNLLYYGKLISKIDKLHSLYLEKYEENNMVCGRMIMSYYAIDTMIIDGSVNKKYISMYGGGTNPCNHDINYMNKYIKYKAKYIKLKNYHG